ncbi:MAG: hypothetical protein Q4E53_11115 [Eubacteriales bacterium]|nr:hypothetical protein [Eubacteriales bacterium]
MTEKELKKLSRIEILEIMLDQGKEIEQLKEVIADQEAKLSDRSIKIEKAGTIADASFALNGVLESAQKAADQYLENIKTLSENQDSICAAKMQEVEEQCKVREQEMKATCEEMYDQTVEYCTNLKKETEADCGGLKVRLQTKIQELEDYEGESKAKCDAMEKEAKTHCDALKKSTEYICDGLKRDAENQAKEIVDKAQLEADAKMQLADSYYEDKVKQVEAEVEARWQTLSQRLEDFYQAHAGLKEIMNLTNSFK